jgi:hypothetical protein
MYKIIEPKKLLNCAANEIDFLCSCEFCIFFYHRILTSLLSRPLAPATTRSQCVTTVPPPTPLVLCLDPVSCATVIAAHA